MSFTRRLVITNLPDNITAAQVLKAVRGWGGIYQIKIINPGRLTDGETSSAMIEFNWSSTARVFVAHFRRWPIRFIDAKGRASLPQVMALNTRTYPHYSVRSVHRRQSGLTVDHISMAGRVLQFLRYPKQGIWSLLDYMGFLNIIDVSFKKTDSRGKHLGDPDVPHFEYGTLTVEFSSVVAAQNARAYVENGLLPHYRLGGDRKIQDFYSGSAYYSEDIEMERENVVVPYIPVDHIAKKWDVYPYNAIFNRTTQLSSDRMQRSSARVAQLPRAELTQALDRSLCVDLDYVAMNADSVRLMSGKTYTIVGCTTRISLVNDTWVIAGEAELEDLSNKTLDRPSWAPFWDLWYKNNQKINIRKPESYAKPAKPIASVEPSASTEVQECTSQKACNCPDCKKKKAAIRPNIPGCFSFSKRKTYKV